MSGVVMRRLGDVAEMYQPKTLSRKDLVSTGPFSVYGANGIIGRHDAFNHEDPQILISCRGTCGRVLRSEPRSWINGNAMVVRSIEESLSFDYLELVLRHSVDLESAINGVAQPQITRSSLEPLELPLPPLEEQRRIAETLDTADGIRRRHLQARDEAKALLAALSAREFTRLEEDASVQKVRLGDVAEFLDHLRRPIKSSDRVPGDVPYYGANGQQDSVSGFIFDETLVLLAEDGGHFDNPDRSIAYLIEGKSWVNNHAHVIRCLGQIDPFYLVRLLGPMDVSVYLSGSTRPKLTKGQAALIEIPLPPLDEQRRIAEMLDAADSLARRHQAAADDAVALLASLSHDIFTRLEQEARRESA